MAENIENKNTDKVVTEPVAPKRLMHPEMPKSPAVIVLWVMVGVIGLMLVVGGTAAIVRNLRGNVMVRSGARVEMMGGNRSLGRGGMMRGNGFRTNSALSENEVSGKVTAVNDKQFTMTVGSTSKTVQISDTTRFPNTSATKVAVGDTVVVVGQQDSNGVIQATEIAVNLNAS